MEKKFVTYEEFGAVGDGKHDDFKAIFAAHEYANANKLAVKGREGATYYVEDTAVGADGKCLPAEIKTDVDWTGVSFLIDDTGLKTYKEDFLTKYMKPLFSVVPDYPAIILTKPEELEGIVIPKGSKKIDLGEKYRFSALIIPEDDSAALFRRYGYTNRLYGEPKREVIVIDKDGNVREETPVIYDYQRLSKLAIYRIDETPITIKGGKFTTIKPRTDRWLSGMKTSYIVRGLSITRSNVTFIGTEKYNTGGVKYVSEFLKGELAGIAYHGFYSVSCATNVIFKDCVMTANMSYGHSTYAHNADYCNHIIYDHCELSNFWVKVDYENDRVLEKRFSEKVPGDGYVSPLTQIPYESKEIHQKLIDRGAPATETRSSLIYWGSGGSNFSKNVQMINGTSLSRFDAHQGLYNGLIRDSAIRFVAITGTANDETPTNFVVENSTLFSSYNSLIMLRGDYGGTWQGDVSFKNVNVYVDDVDDFFIVSKGYRNWYFGYETYFPNITMDNVSFYNREDFDGGRSPKERGIAPISKTFPFFSSVLQPETRMHLKESHVHPYIEIRDKDGDPKASYTLDTWTKNLSDGTRVIEPCEFVGGDGYIDAPFDMDGDGKVGNLMVNGKPIAVKDVVDYLNSCDQNWSVGGLLADGRGGFIDTMANFNITHTPGYIKIINNESGHKYRVMKTAGLGVPTTDGSSDMGGYLGNTKFYYTDADYFVGTDYSEDETENTPFIFA